MECVARMERILDVVRENAKIGGFAVKRMFCCLVGDNSPVVIRFDQIGHEQSGACGAVQAK